jgi:hypothetical protein
MTTLTTSILAASTGTAAGVSLVYLLLGGGFLGAVIIFAVAKLLKSLCAAGNRKMPAAKQCRCLNSC